MVKELKHSKIESRDVTTLNEELEVKLAAAKTELEDLQSEKDPENRILSQKERLEVLEKKLEEATVRAENLEREKCEIEKSLTLEKDELERRLSTVLRLCGGLQQLEGEELEHGNIIENDRVTSGSKTLVENGTQTDGISASDFKAKVELVSQETQVEEVTATGETDDHRADREVQVDTISKEISTRYEQKLSKMRCEAEELKKRCGAQVKDAEEKIHQLLGFKETLTAKNAQLAEEVKQLKKAAPGSPVVTQKEEQQRSIEEAQKKEIAPSMCNGEVSTEEQLRRAHSEIEELKRTHSDEREAMRQRLMDAITKVKEREVKYLTEIKELKSAIEKTQREMNSSLFSENIRIPENNLVSFREVKGLGSRRLEEGNWGYAVQGQFRGKSVCVKCISNESLARFPVNEIHKQLSCVINLRHPNLVLFVAVSMDAPNGMMILNELMRCSLKQTYQTGGLMGGTDKLPILCDIAVALNYLHLQSKPVAHNNLSSCSIWLEELATAAAAGGRKWRAKLSDIGYTVPLLLISDPRKRPPVYQAPEIDSQNAVRRNVSSSVDVYSFGVLLCEVARDSLPESTESLMSSVEGLKGTLPQVASLAMSCVAPNPEQRPSIGQMVSKIQNLVVNKIVMS